MQRSGIGSFLIGAGMGAAMAMLFAPSSGSKARTHITKAAADGATYLKEMRDTVVGAVESTVERSRDQIARQKEGVTQAIKHGSEAYKRALS